MAVREEAGDVRLPPTTDVTLCSRHARFVPRPDSDTVAANLGLCLWDGSEAACGA